MTNYLSSNQIIALNIRLIRDLSVGERINILHPTLLDSAVNRPRQTIFGEDAYPTIFEKAAALFESLVLNHIFENANKRTAFSALDIFLYYNGYDFFMEKEIAVTFTLDIVLKKYSIQQSAQLIEKYSRILE